MKLVWQQVQTHCSKTSCSKSFLHLPGHHPTTLVASVNRHSVAPNFHRSCAYLLNEFPLSLLSCLFDWLCVCLWDGEDLTHPTVLLWMLSLSFFFLYWLQITGELVNVCECACRPTASCFLWYSRPTVRDRPGFSTVFRLKVYYSTMYFIENVHKTNFTKCIKSHLSWIQGLFVCDTKEWINELWPNMYLDMIICPKICKLYTSYTHPSTYPSEFTLHLLLYYFKLLKLITTQTISLDFYIILLD